MVQAAPELAGVGITDRVEVAVAGRTFYQEELGIEQAACLAESVLTIVSEASQEGTLDMNEIEKLDTEDLSTVWPVLQKLARKLPALLGEVFASALVTAEGDMLGPDDRLWVRRHLKLRNAMGMIRTFVKQNDLADIASSFTSTRDAVSAGLQELASKSQLSPTEEKS